MDICWPASPKIPFPSNFIYSILGRDDYFLFGSVFIKNNQTEYFFKKNQNQFKPTGFDSVFYNKNRFKTDLARFFQFSSVLARFGSVFFVSGLKNQTGRFF
jgi:hypothetical protein